MTVAFNLAIIHSIIPGVVTHRITVIVMYDAKYVQSRWWHIPILQHCVALAMQTAQTGLSRPVPKLPLYLELHLLMTAAHQLRFCSEALLLFAPSKMYVC